MQNSTCKEVLDRLKNSLSLVDSAIAELEQRHDPRLLPDLNDLFEKRDALAYKILVLSIPKQQLPVAPTASTSVHPDTTKPEEESDFSMWWFGAVLAGLVAAPFIVKRISDDPHTSLRIIQDIAHGLKRVSRPSVC